ncbi:MAG: transglutaminase domain-containing protein, partial [Oscillospiraceae bacterium]|nr:transglutaminase domain-containing protein [Oscillospiraceae bacterium]
MKNTLKRSLALLLALIMSVSALPIEVFAAEAEEAVTELSAEVSGEAEETALSAKLSAAYINPVYADVISEDDLISDPNQGLSGASVDTYYSTVAEVGKVLRAAMKERTETVEVGYTTTTAINSQESLGVFLTETSDAAVAHTGEPTEGDYLKFQFAGIKCASSGYVSGGTYYYPMTYTVTYYDTAQQEAEMDKAVGTLLNSLNLSGASDYEKIKGVYDYICANVTYDYDNLEDEDYKLKYTGYAALVNKTAVCQGYAVLFYRLMLELGVDAR